MGRVNSALDPANTQMFENVINYKPEYILDQDGHRCRVQTNASGAYVLKNNTTYDPNKQGFVAIDTSLLIPAVHGNYFRQWRPQIHKPDDICRRL